jgi:S-(hydroxymethyl)glutathione dehydrogenase/alcohol dehydrogenase
VPRAAVCHRFGEPLTVEEVWLSEPREGEVLVRLEACAICHSDVAYAAGAWGGTVPTVLGHEACGLVAEAGPGVSSLRPGQRVVVSLIRHCGACDRCRAGEPALCEAMFPLDERSPIRGAGGEIAQGLRCGAFAEEVIVHVSQAVPVPRHLPAASLAVLGCAVLTGIGAAERAGRVGPGQVVAVIGAGGVGLNAIQGAVLAGAERVIAIDIADDKLAAAKAFGATDAVNARESTPRSRPPARRARSSRGSRFSAAAARSWSWACRRAARRPASTRRSSPTTGFASSAPRWGRPGRRMTSRAWWPSTRTAG